MSFTGTSITPGRFQTYNPSNNLDSANKLFDRISERVRGRSVSKVLGEYDTNATDAISGHADLTRRLTAGGATPLEALGLANQAYQPVYKQMQLDSGAYGFQTDDLGNAYRYNKNTGDYDIVNSAPDGYVNPKNITLKTITNRTPSGVETTNQVPFNKVTGEPVNNTVTEPVDINEQVGNYITETYGIDSIDALKSLPSDKLKVIEDDINKKFYSTGNAVANPPMGGVGVKYPTADKATKEGADALGASMNLIDRIKVPTEGQSGPFDSRVDDVAAWLNIDTEDSVAAKNFDSEVANLTTAFGTAQVKGVLSDKDTKFITDQMPDRTLSPKINANRINSIKKKLQEATERFNKANPYHKVTASDKDVNSPDVMQRNGAIYDKVDGGWKRRK